MPEQQFTIQPAPAQGGGINAGLQQGAAGAFHAKGPHVPAQEILSKLDAPLSREELMKRQEELNK